MKKLVLVFFALLNFAAFAAPDMWEADVKKFEASDILNPPPKDAIVFAGSSSIRLWENLPSYFPEHKVIQRGLGGSEIIDMVAFYQRVITKYDPKTIVIYSGENDLANHKSPEFVLENLKKLVHLIRNETGAPIIYISIKPSPARMQFFEAMKQTNSLIKEASSELGITFIDIFSLMLGDDGRPNLKLYKPDQIHLLPAGYMIWKKVLGPYL